MNLSTDSLLGVFDQEHFLEVNSKFHEDGRWSLEKLATVAAPELTYVAGESYRLTLITIAIPNKEKLIVGHARIHRDEYQLFSLEFIGIDQPRELSGTWTHHNLVIAALRDHALKAGWTIDMTIISADGSNHLSVNMKAI